MKKDYEHLNAAKLLLNLKQYQFAERELFLRLERNFRDAAAHALLSACYLKQNRIKEAAKEAVQAIRYEPENALCHFSLGEAMLKNKQLLKARKSVLESVRLAPEHALYKQTLIEIYLLIGDVDRSLHLLRIALRIDPENVYLLNLKARCLLEIGPENEIAALLILDKALALDPINPKTFVNKGGYYLNRKEISKAKKYFLKALSFDPELEAAHQGLALCKGFLE